MGSFHIEVLSAGHDRTAFDCGTPALNEYLAKQAGQDTRRRIATCFVAIEKTSGHLAGYYTLSACGVALDDLPADIKKKLPRYPTNPAILIGRLAVDRRFQGQRLGEALLANALRRMLIAEIAASMAVVDAKDEPAAKFYQRFGFRELAANPRRLFIPLSKKLRELGSID